MMPGEPIIDFAPPPDDQTINLVGLSTCDLIALYDRLSALAAKEKTYLGPPSKKSDQALLATVREEISIRQEQAGESSSFDEFIALKRIQCQGEGKTTNEDQTTSTIIEQEEDTGMTKAGFDLSFSNPVIKWGIIILTGVLVWKLIKK